MGCIFKNNGGTIRQIFNICITISSTIDWIVCLWNNFLSLIGYLDPLGLGGINIFVFRWDELLFCCRLYIKRYTSIGVYLR